LLLALGCVFGIDQRFLVSQSWPRIVHALSGTVRVQDQPPERAELGPFLTALAAAAEPLPAERAGLLPMGVAGSYQARRSWAGVSAEETRSVTYEVLFEEIDAHLSEGWFVILDTCLGSYPGADLRIQSMGRFMGNPVWLSIGHSLGAAVGVSFATDDPLLVICGDGGFQMTAQALSTLAKEGRSVLVLVIDNGTYAIEQYLIDNEYFKGPNYPALPFVQLNRWDYAILAKALGAKATWRVTERPALRRALQEARHTGGLSVLVVSVDPRDLPPENRIPLAQGR
jgi:indolepyruvate decarboxylase